MDRLITAIALTMVLTLSVNSVSAECHFVSLREFHVTKSADPFSKGNFSPLIALEPGRYYPLAPEYMVEAPHGVMMQGRKYYIPRHLVDGRNRFSLRLMMVDLDKDTPDDLVLPPTEGTISLPARGSSSNTHLVTKHFEPFSDEPQMRSNAQRFTFEISDGPGPCDESTSAGQLADRSHRQDNNLLRLHAQILFYDRPHPVGGHDYRPYRTGKIVAARRPLALARAFDVARVNALELVALGREAQSLRGAPGFKRIWNDYTRLVKRLALQKIQLRYRNENKVKKKASTPSLAFHPGWKILPNAGEYPVLPTEWEITFARK